MCSLTRPFAAFLPYAALLLHIKTTYANANTCNVGFSATCDPIKFTATSNVFVHVNRTSSNADVKTFNATIVFHWGVDDFTIPSASYNISHKAAPDVVALSNTFEYSAEGFYPAGYSVSFDDDAANGCSGKTFGSIKTLKMERTPSVCKWDAETPSPTGRPTASMWPTTTPRPTGSLAEVGSPGAGDDSGGAVTFPSFGLLTAGAVSAMGFFLL